MVQVIGFMIGFYIITRMIENIMNKSTETPVAIFSFITILICAVGLYFLFTTGAAVTSAIQQ